MPDKSEKQDDKETKEEEEKHEERRGEDEKETEDRSGTERGHVEFDDPSMGPEVQHYLSMRALDEKLDLIAKERQANEADDETDIEIYLEKDERKAKADQQVQKSSERSS